MKGKPSHLAIHHLALLGPVPHGEHMIVGFVHCTEQVAPILWKTERWLGYLSPIPLQPSCLSKDLHKHDL